MAHFMRSLARSPAIQPSLRSVSLRPVNAVPVARQVFNLLSAMVLPLFVLWNNHARRRRFHHHACPVAIFERCVVKGLTAGSVKWAGEQTPAI